MKNKLTAITDENAILVTVEFLTGFSKYKVGEVCQKETYEIDLIVKNDVKIKDLLWAIDSGLKNKFPKEIDVSNHKPGDWTVYKNQRNPDVEISEKKFQGSKLKKGNFKVTKNNLDLKGVISNYKNSKKFAERK